MLLRQVCLNCAGSSYLSRIILLIFTQARISFLGVIWDWLSYLSGIIFLDYLTRTGLSKESGICFHSGSIILFQQDYFIEAGLF